MPHLPSWPPLTIFLSPKYPPSHPFKCISIPLTPPQPSSPTLLPPPLGKEGTIGKSLSVFLLPQAGSPFPALSPLPNSSLAGSYFIRSFLDRWILQAQMMAPGPLPRA